MAIFSSIIKPFLGGYATHVEMVSVTKDIIHVSFGTMNPLEEPMYILVPKKAFLQYILRSLLLQDSPMFLSWDMAMVKGNDRLLLH